MALPAFLSLSLPANYPLSPILGPLQKKVKTFDGLSFFFPIQNKKSFIKSHGGENAFLRLFY